MLYTIILIFLTLGAVFCHESFLNRVRRAGDSHWTYQGDTGVDKWSHLFPSNCGGKKQSPIDIKTNKVQLDEKLGTFTFHNYEHALQDPTISNNGHTVQISPNGSNMIPEISGGGLTHNYRFLQMHFHWGSHDKVGSEHTIDGVKFPIELHLVHYNTKYNKVQDALKKSDGLAVLGILYKTSENNNKALSPIINSLKDVHTPNVNSVMKGKLKLASLLPKDTVKFYRYDGSLTTPKCNEIVTWTVFSDLATISPEQLENFRELQHGDEQETESLADNYRPVQNLNGRTVFVSASASIALPSLSFLIFVTILRFLN